MPTLETLQKVIQTTKDLRSIVKTMKVLAAVSIHQYERAVESLMDYSRTVNLGMQGVNHRNRLTLNAPLTSERRGTGLVVFGSDHGLCGRFNESISDFVLEKINKPHLTGKHHRLMTVGARINAALEAHQVESEVCFVVPGSVSGISGIVRKIVIKLDSWQAGNIETIRVFHNQRRTGSTHYPRMIRLLPIELNQFNDIRNQSWPSRSNPFYTIPEDRLIRALLRQYLFISIFRACAESLASEHASRLVSMQIAEKNINERLDELGTGFRQQRQNVITEELLDVVAGFEALTGKH